jgi:hypothetical protein
MPNTQQPERRLPGPVIDFLALQALIFGGIGSSAFYDEKDQPLCAHGMCNTSYNPLLGTFDEEMELRTHLLQAGITYPVNDAAVQNARRRLRLKPGSRVPFEEWAAELNIVPVDELEA